MEKKECFNKNCWLVNALDYAPYKRCQHCDLKFRKCLFLHYQIISLVLIVFFFALSFLVDGRIPELVIISVFTMAIVYGYFFNKSTDKIIRANFAERKAREALGELNEKLEEKVREQTKEIRGQKEEVEKAFEIEKKALKKEMEVHQELERLDKAKNQFMLATQHHLRTPLTSMRGYLDLIFGGTYGKIPPKLKEILKRFEISTKNEVKLVNEFLDVSQFQLGKGVVILRDGVEMQKIIMEAVSDVEIEAKSKGIYVRAEISKNTPPIKADEFKLKAAVYNIVDNAVKYTKKGGVVISLKKTDDKLRILIKDTGIGISKEEISKLFGKLFERGEQAEKIFSTGRGIGLYITFKIIEAHNGRIWAESEGIGKGSTFIIELPIGNLTSAENGNNLQSVN